MCVRNFLRSRLCLIVVVVVVVIVVVVQDALHLDSPLTDPDLESLRLTPRLDYSTIAAADSLGGVQRNLAWFRPFNKPSAHLSAAHDNPSANAPGIGDADLPASVTTEPIRATRLGKGRARKGDRQGDLVWPEHIEAALIEGQSTPLAPIRIPSLIFELH